MKRKIITAFLSVSLSLCVVFGCAKTIVQGFIPTTTESETQVVAQAENNQADDIQKPASKSLHPKSKKHKSAMQKNKNECSSDKDCTENKNESCSHTADQR
ncbi:MAG: hypothetical protein ACI4HI_05645 [Lachnospiraceae bacterium]